MNSDWDRLVRFLRDVWELPSIELACTPRRITGGYGRRSWLLELAAPEWRRCFQLRCSGPGKASLGHEYGRLRWLASRGYPVSSPVLWVEDVGVLGEPFALLEWVSGETLAERIRTKGWHSDGRDGRTIGLLLARLHSLSPDEFPAEAAPGTLMPTLNGIAELIGPTRFDAVREWFDGHRVSPRTLSVCHLDLHPLNVVMSRHEVTVIDWEMARLDDPLLDVAMAQVHVEVSLGWGELPRMEDRFAYGRSVSAAYSAFRSVPEADLRYYRVLAACRRLGDVAGAGERADMPDEVRAELQAEGSSAIGILDHEIGFAG